MIASWVSSIQIVRWALDFTKPPGAYADIRCSLASGLCHLISRPVFIPPILPSPLGQEGSLEERG